MLRCNWLAEWKQLGRIFSSPASKRRRKRRSQIPYLAEVLEERVLLAVFTVNTTDDVIAEDGNVSLREALQAANTNEVVNADVGAGDVTGDIIIFDSTVFGGAGATITLNSSLGQLSITDDLEIDGVTGSGGGATDVTIDGQNLIRIFNIDTAANAGFPQPVELIGMTLTNGFTSGDGGAILIADNENVTLDDVDISGSTAVGFGGGIANGDGKLTVNGGLIFNNVANRGGGIINDGGTLFVNDVSITNNNASVAGGGIESRTVTGRAVQVVLNDVFIAGNSAGVNGGGLHVTAPTTLGAHQLQINGGDFAGNTAGQEGGGLWNDAGGEMTINGTTIGGSATAGNVAQIGNAANDAQGGGGVFNNGGTVNISNATITHNVVSGTSGGADDGGGGVFNDGRNNPNATVTLNNVTISNNLVLSTSLNGGGVLNIGVQGNNATVNINNGSVTNNRAARAGGGIEGNNGVINLNGVTVFNNSAGVNGGGLHVTGADQTNVTAGTFQGNSAGQEGGGLWNSATGTMTIDGTTIEGNTAFNGNAANDAQGGGGVFNNGGSLTISHATISNNAVFGGTDSGADDGGGGIFSDGRNTTGATVTLNNVTIENNRVLSTSLNGGGVFNLGAGTGNTTLNVNGGVISGNSAARAGGGIESRSGIVNLNGTNVTGNSAGVNGGGLHISVDGATNVNQSSFSGNTAGQEGGGLWNAGMGTMQIANSSIESNTALIGNAAADAQGGGGVFNDGGNVTITDSTITNNLVMGASGGADDGGGGIFNDGRNETGAFVTLNNVTVTGNNVLGTSLNGGGIMNIGEVGGNATINVNNGSIIGNSAVRAGGGIESNNGNVNLDGVLVAGNSTGVNGGGLHVTGADNTVIRGTIFLENQAGQEGGGIWNSAMGQMTIGDDSVIDGNIAFIGNAAGDAQGGGGVFNNGGTLSITGGRISNNVVSGATAGADDGGGGIFNDGRNTTGATVTLNNVTIENNHVLSTSLNGGGVLSIGDMDSTPTTTINGGRVAGNLAARAGGGIETNNGVLNLNGVTVVGNSAGVNGGGLHVAGADVTTVTGGTFSNNTAAQEGGGLWNSATGQMTLTNATISGNSAFAGNSADAQGGGGVFNNGGTVALSGGTISGNVVIGVLDSTDGGGGIFNDGRNTDGATITIVDTVIINNDVIHAFTGLAGRGGGILNIADNSNTASITMTGGSISNNSAAQAGGGIENQVLNSDTLGMAGGNITLNAVTLNANLTENNGGAVHLGGTSGMLDFTATDSTFSNNSAGNEGGGLWNESNPQSRITLNSSTVNGNSSPNGGGLFQNDDGSPGTTTINNSTISGNIANTGGGIDSEGGNINVNFSTIAFNFANTAGGLNVEVGTSATFSGSLVANNAASTAPDVAGAVAADFSLFSNTSGLTIGLGSNNLLNVDPRLGPLQGNGGPTLTHALLPGSPAINAGDPAFSSPPDFDQRGTGFPRLIGGRIDIGAIESDIDILAVGTGQGADTVTVFNAMSGDLLRTFSAYGGFGGGVRVATGDINGDGVTDVVTGAGPGGGPHIKVFDGTNGALIRSFFGFAAGFRGGLFVEAADLNNDGFDDIIVSADAGGGPHVRIFSGADGSELFSFFALDPGFTGGIRVAAGDISNDGIPDLITGVGPGGGPLVRVFNGATMAPVSGPLGGFFAFDVSFTGGVYVAAGNVGGNENIDVIVGRGPGGPPDVRVFNGATGAILSTAIGSFQAYAPGFLGGVRVSAGEFTGDDLADIITAPGPGGGPNLRVFDATDASIVRNIFVGSPSFTGGLFVAGEPSLYSSGAPLLLAGGFDSSSSAAPLSLADVQPVFLAAISRFEAAGLSQAQANELAGVSVEVADLNGARLGEALPGRILLDVTAAGAGWFIDSTPFDDEEFDSAGLGDVGGVDLLTVLLHELGHHLGGVDLDAEDHPDHLMADSLATGQRRLPSKEELDELFSDPSFLD